MMLRSMRGGFVRSAQLASVVALMVGCAAPGAPPATAPPAKEQPAQPAATAAVQAAPTGATAPQVQPGVSRLVMSVAPPGRESNDVRFTGNVDLWALRPMYEFLIGLDPQTGKYIPQL